jgi:hypothetical protein
MDHEKSLSKNQLQELSSLEKTIEVNLKSFYEVGLALKKIKNDRLYRENFKTFEEYCRERWGISKPRAYQLIEAVDIKTNLSTTVDISSSIGERQLRPLAVLEPDQQPDAWKQANETAPGGLVTAQHVTKVVREIKNKTQNIIQQGVVVGEDKEPEGTIGETINLKTGEVKPEEIRTDKDFISIRMEGIFNQLRNEIKHVKKLGWITTSRNAVLYQLLKLETMVKSN